MRKRSILPRAALVALLAGCGAPTAPAGPESSPDAVRPGSAPRLDAAPDTTDHTQSGFIGSGYRSDTTGVLKPTPTNSSPSPTPTNAGG